MRSFVYSLCLIVMAVSIARIHAQDRAFSVRDDIEMVRFSDPRSLPGVRGSEIARRSPDGKHFVVVTTKGLLKSDQVESDLLIFDVQDARVFLESATSIPHPKPRTIATIVSFPHHEEVQAYAPVIRNLRWSSDSSRIYFRGEDGQGVFRLYVAAIDESDVETLSPSGYSVSQYDLAKDTIVYRAAQMAPQQIDSDKSINADARVMTGQRFQDVLFNLSDFEPKTFSLWVTKRIKGRYLTKRVPDYSVRDLAPLADQLFPFVMSPMGDMLLELNPVARIPPSWESYEPAKGFEYLRYRISDPRLMIANNLFRPQQYTVTDLSSGKQAELVSAPNARTLVYNADNLVAWSEDERRVLVTNTFLPLDNISATERARRLTPCDVASVEIRSLEVQCLMSNENSSTPQNAIARIRGVSFGENDDEALLSVDSISGANAVQRYGYRHDKWTLMESEPISSSSGRPANISAENQPTNEDLGLAVKQSLNDPPTLWVSNTRTGQSRQLWDPNPKFAHILFGNVSVYRWKDKNGYEWKGGLVKPVNYVPGRHYPLIIQMYSFYDDQFMTDGMDPTAFAARHLASSGFVVLQIQKKAVHTHDDAEAQDHLEGYRSAIERLSSDGLVDASKVGAVGFSWTCWYVENALIRAPKLFAAATIADGVDHSYMEYHLFGESSRTLQLQDERIIGAKPVGEGLNRWLEWAPGFHLDQVRTPLRIEAINPWSLLGEWEIYSSLRMQGKPVDLIFFPSGTHIHQKPLERLESQQGDVDWFRFWLQGYEDPDPAKLSQYERWRRLREDKNVKGSLVP